MAMTYESEEDSEAERTVLCEKIISDIEAVLLKDTDLSSFEIIPFTMQRNKSPVIHVEHNLGLESWCAQLVYEYVHHKLIQWKRQTLPLRSSCQYLSTGISSGGSGLATIQKYLDIALLINPDAQSFWHLRKYLFQKRCQLSLNDELRFTILVFSKKPKSSEAFAYRRWLITSAEAGDTTRDSNRSRSLLDLDWRTEIEICERCSETSASNYHAWSHRQWVVLNITPEQGRDLLISSELDKIKYFMLKHITDYSCYHYRQWLISYAYRVQYFKRDLLNPQREEFDSILLISDLQRLITYYLVADVQSASEVLDIMIPGVDRSKAESTQLNSFLYCCNLAAHDVRLCEEQKNVYGEHESFDLHRRASLKFIVDQCVHWLRNRRKYCNLSSATQDAITEGRLENGTEEENECETSSFLKAIKKSEGLLGSRHRKWCSLFLGFNYSNDNKSDDTDDYIIQEK